eukprot:1145125-Pelagomonas_calceolata.AAC.5
MTHTRSPSNAPPIREGFLWRSDAYSAKLLILAHLASGVDNAVQGRLVHAICPPFQHVTQIDDEALRPARRAATKV